MKSSCTHSFALLALSFLTIQFASGLSIDSKALANLQPRLDGDAVRPDASSSSSATHKKKKKKCKMTRPISGVAQSTGDVLPIITSSPIPTGNATTLAPGNHLTYARSYKTKCSKKTSAVPSASNSPDSGPGIPGSDSNTGGGSGSGSSTPASGLGSGSESKPDVQKANAGPHDVNNDSTGSSANGGQSVCGPRQTVTVTIPPTTVTVTQNAQAAGSASASKASSVDTNGSSNGSHGSGSQGGQGDAQSNPASPSSAAAESGSSSGGDSGADTVNTGNAGSENSASGNSGSPASGNSASANSASGGSEISGTGNSGTGSAGDSGSGNSGSGNSGSGNSGSGNSGSGNSGSGNSGSGNTGSGNSGSGNTGFGNSGSGNSGSGNTGSGNSGSGNSGSGNSGSGNSGSGNTGSSNEGSSNEGSSNEGSSNEGSSNEGSSNEGSNNEGSGTSKPNASSSESSRDTSSAYFGNQTVSGRTSPTSTGHSFAPQQAMNTTSSSNSTNATSNVNLNGQFWAGADIGTLMRMEAIPQRVFYDYDGKTVKDPIKTLADSGINAMRVTTERGQCLGPTNFVNDGTTLEKESYYELDWGCIDIQVKTAQRSVAQGMRVMLTINQGFALPAGMESFSYEQMVEEVQKEAKRQLQPFLSANIVPDIILLENEGTDGFLFNETATGHTRGKNDGKAPIEQVNKEMCGILPTGSMASFPQYAGYLKAEIIACNEAITAAGFSTDTVRYGLHSHGQYVQWKEGVVHGPDAPDQSTLADSAGNGCSNAVIPVNIISQNVSEMLNIMGFSAYADPMRPTDINSESSQRNSLNRTLTTLTQMMGYSEAYGKYESGPFKGEYKLQALGVEYATSYDASETQQEQKETAMMWSLVKQFGNVLGMMWWEPWYCNNHWEGGKGALCHMVGDNGVSGIAPDETLKVWGSAARSPWKT